jgi:hypothetical protein
MSGRQDHCDLLRSTDAGRQLLLDEMLAYPAIDMQKRQAHLRFFTTLTTLGTPYHIALHELRTESFFPADEPTDTALRALRAAPSQ